MGMGPTSSSSLSLASPFSCCVGFVPFCCCSVLFSLALFPRAVAEVDAAADDDAASTLSLSMLSVYCMCSIALIPACFCFSLLSSLLPPLQIPAINHQPCLREGGYSQSMMDGWTTLLMLFALDACPSPVPPSYKDLGKATSDLLNKDYPLGVSTLVGLSISFTSLPASAPVALVWLCHAHPAAPVLYLEKLTMHPSQITGSQDKDTQQRALQSWNRKERREECHPRRPRGKVH